MRTCPTSPWENISEDTKITFSSVTTTSESWWLEKEMLGSRPWPYLPGPQTQERHSIAIIQLDGPGLLFLLHGVKNAKLPEETRSKLSAQTATASARFLLFFLFSIQPATAESVSWVLPELCVSSLLSYRSSWTPDLRLRRSHSILHLIRPMVNY